MLQVARSTAYDDGHRDTPGEFVTPIQFDSTVLSLTPLVPEVARDLAAELDAMLVTSGTPGMLKMVTALASAIVLRDADLLRAMTALAVARGNDEAPTRAVSVAMHYAHANPVEHRDALARLVTDAISRGLRTTPPQRGERIDPLLAECVDVVEIVHALSMARFSVTASAANASVSPGSPSSMSAPQRRVTRDFEAASGPLPRPPRTMQTSTPAPPRSTMRPAPARSTMRPTARNNTLRPPEATSDVRDDAVLTPRTQVRDAHGRPLKKKW